MLWRWGDAKRRRSHSSSFGKIFIRLSMPLTILRISQGHFYPNRRSHLRTVVFVGVERGGRRERIRLGDQHTTTHHDEVRERVLRQFGLEVEEHVFGIHLGVVRVVYTADVLCHKAVLFIPRGRHLGLYGRSGGVLGGLHVVLVVGVGLSVCSGKMANVFLVVKSILGFGGDA